SYPPAALALKFEGKVRVEFHLKDRVPSAARVVVSSNIGMIDRAALQAVQNANYAEPPPELQGKDHIFVGNVAFYLPRN
ncbi:TonB family protein, partial [Pseudoalteromonas distincta]|uniref:TonB family protein n=1 Tax=Pseudoalteromonas distincta TaxID=77608 RepID=UPI0034E883EE